MTDGVLRVDKPAGPTSHDVVDAVRRALGTRRVGHTGTLDPFATGLLLVCVGKATRLSEYLTGERKRYEARARLGVETDTLDPEGEVVARDDAWRELQAATIEEAVRALAGEQMQVPPAHSAKKVGGRRAYEMARAGEKVELEPVSVTVYEAQALEIDPPDVGFAVECSSGTYVRALARDLGRSLGSHAHLLELRRTAVGSIGVDGAVPLDRLDDVAARDAAWLSPLDALAGFPTAVLDDEDAARVRHGGAVQGEAGTDGERVALVADGELLAIAERRGDRLQPRKVLA